MLRASQLRLIISLISGMVIALGASVCLEAASESRPNEVHRWSVFETALAAERDYAEPLWDVQVEVAFVSPSGKKRLRQAFWDGGRTWRVRFSPDEVGIWRWESKASPENDGGLHGRQGEFRVIEYHGKNPLYRHGTLRIAGSGTHIEHADGTPFFWLSDTAWNGVLKATAEEWREYLATRQRQGFTAIQFVATQWRGGDKTLQEHVFSKPGRLRVHPDVLRKMDRKVAMINEHHMVAVVVLLWALINTDPGLALPEEEAQKLSEYLVARWGAYQVAWLLGGDSHYRDTDRWRRLGRNLFESRPRDRLVSLHPSGQNWVWDRFGAENWVDFLGYQSGHGDNQTHLRWLVEGPPAQSWQRKPIKPVINLEPNYEAHPAYHSGKAFEPYHVRRATYWSLLVTPPAGISYGHHAIWPWLSKPGPAERHERLGIVPVWREGLESEGIRGLGIAKQFFLSGPWTQLRPSPELLLEQPGTKDVTRFITISATADRKWLVAYLPRGGVIRLRRDTLADKTQACWFDPRTGKKHDAQAERTANDVRFTAPDNLDWVLELRGE